MTRWSIPLALGACLTLGCQGADSNAPHGYSMSGTWLQSGDLTDQTDGQTHLHIGTYTLRQTGDAFSGTGQQDGSCHGPQGNFTSPLADPAPFAVTKGTLVGRQMQFDTPACHFEGEFQDGNPNTMTGTATCSYSQGGTTYTFVGPWLAYR